MDGGWAVVLGAVIALAGSALIPWLRDAQGERRQAVQRAKERRSDAIVELLAANAGLGTAIMLDQKDQISDRYERRSRAAARLLLEVGPEERRALGHVLDLSFPISGKGDGAPPPQKIIALQRAITQWGAGDIPVEEIEATYNRVSNL